MKIKRHEGPREFLRMEKFKADNPRANKLLIRRKRLLEHMTIDPSEIDRLALKVDRIEMELKRLGVISEKDYIKFKGPEIKSPLPSSKT